MKKICLIYYLSETPPFTTEQLKRIKDDYEADKVIMVKACNQLQGLQYPYITFDELEDSECLKNNYVIPERDTNTDILRDTTNYVPKKNNE